MPARHIPGDLASRAARFRFVVWSLTPRLGEPLADELLPETIGWPTDFDTPIDGEFVLAQARAAREDWLGFLNAWEDDPWLASQHASGHGRLEKDLRWLTSTWPRVSRNGDCAGWPPPQDLDLGSARATDKARKDERRRVAADIAERHWLPRGSLLGAAAALFPGHRGLRWLSLSTFPALSLVVVALFLLGSPAARWCALGLVGLGLVATSFGPARLDSLALLRIPAAAAAGEAVLLALTSRWWIAANG